MKVDIVIRKPIIVKVWWRELGVRFLNTSFIVAKFRPCMALLLVMVLMVSPALAESNTPYFDTHSIESVEYDDLGNPVITDAGCIIWTNATLHYRHGFNRVDNVLVVLKNESGSTIDYGYCDLIQNSTKEGFVLSWLNFGSNQPAGTYTLRYQVNYVDQSGSDEKLFLTESFTCTKSATVTPELTTPEPEQLTTVIETTTEYTPVLVAEQQDTTPEPEPELTEVEQGHYLGTSLLALFLLALSIVVLYMKSREG